MTHRKKQYRYQNNKQSKLIWKENITGKHGELNTKNELPCPEFLGRS